MRSLVLSALILASAFQTALGQIVEGQWTYIVQNGGATIIASTATGAVTIPNSLGGYAVKQVGYYDPPVFGYPNGYPNSSVTSITIPNSVTSIGGYAFNGCAGLTSMNIPNSVTSIGSYAFYDCTSLTSVTIPNSVTSIGDGAFSYCFSLTTITIPSSVTSIGSNAFSNSGLGSVFLSPNLSSSQISQAGFPSTAVFYVGSVGLPTSMASQADLATTQAQLATTQAELATTKSQITTAINEGKASGIASVTASPNTWSLFTTSQIQNMAVGDLVLTRTNGSNLVLNYDIEQSEDLQTWTTYQGYALPLTNLPTNKAFVRIKAKQ